MGVGVGEPRARAGNRLLGPAAPAAEQPNPRERARPQQAALAGAPPPRAPPRAQPEIALVDDAEAAGAAARGAVRSEAELRGMSEDEQLAYALSLSDTAPGTPPPSARSPPPPAAAAARLAAATRPAASRGVDARAPAGGGMSEDEQLAYALSL